MRLVLDTNVVASADLIVTGDKPLWSVGVYHGKRITNVSQAVQLIGPN